MYTAYFGFREKPFNVTPDPRFFYTNHAYQEAYASLLYGIRGRKGLVVLTGEVGTGKTTLLRRLMNNLEETVRFAFFYNTNLTFNELLSFTCEDLGLRVNHGGRLQKIQRLNEFLMERLKAGGTGALLIDEAQNLKDDVLENLRLLSNLETSSEKLLQIILVGQPELEEKLDRPELRQLKQRVAIRCRLPHLQNREVGKFIYSRLDAIGYKGPDLFTPEAIERIAFYSRGIPRLINNICDNVLLVCYGISQKTVSARFVEEVAHDLRLKEEAQAFGKEVPNWAMTSQNGKEEASQALEDEPPRGKQLGPVETPPAPTETAKYAVSPQFFDRMTQELTEAMGPMASVVLRDQISALGENRETFSKMKLGKLVESVSREILDETTKARFRNLMFENIVASARRKPTLARS